MKKCFLIVVAFVLCISVFASSKAIPNYDSNAYDAPRFGFGLAPVGEVFRTVDKTESFGGIAGYVVLSPFSEKHFCDIEFDTVIVFKSPVLRGFNLTVSNPVYVSSVHCFNRFFSNPVFWIPSLRAGVLYRVGNGMRYSIGVEPFLFADTDYVYEFFSPNFIIDNAGNMGWGLTVFKVTAFVGGIK